MREAVTVDTARRVRLVAKTAQVGMPVAGDRRACRQYTRQDTQRGGQ